MKRFFLYIIMVFLCFLLQTSVFQMLRLADIVPNILIALVISIGYMRGHYEAIFTGLLCGLCMDLMYSEVVGFYTLLYSIVGFLSAYSHYYYEADDFTTPIILIGIGDLVYSILFYTLSFLLRARLNVLYYFRRIMVPELIYTVVVAIVLYKLVHWVEQVLIRFEGKEEKYD